jgi:hypothetical protein
MQSSNKSLCVATNNLAVAHHRPATGHVYPCDRSKAIVIDKFNPSSRKTKMFRSKNSAKR